MTETTAATPHLADPQRAALRLGVNAETLKRWRCNGNGPRYIRVARSRVRYRISDLDDWLESRTVTPEPSQID